MRYKTVFVNDDDDVGHIALSWGDNVIMIMKGCVDIWSSWLACAIWIVVWCFMIPEWNKQGATKQWNVLILEKKNSSEKEKHFHS